MPVMAPAHPTVNDGPSHEARPTRPPISTSLFDDLNPLAPAPMGVPMAATPAVPPPVNVPAPNWSTAPTAQAPAPVAVPTYSDMLSMHPRPVVGGLVQPPQSDAATIAADPFAEPAFESPPPPTTIPLPGRGQVADHAWGSEQLDL